MTITNLPLAVANENGLRFATGEPVTFPYIRRNDPAPYCGSLYQQDIEPAGRYLVHNSHPGELGPNWEAGVVSFQFPLVIWFNTDNDVSYNEHSWKAKLVQHFKRKRRQLSIAIRRAGYDGIVTVGQGGCSTKEIVDLTMF